MHPFSFSKSAVHHLRRFVTYKRFPLFIAGILSLALSSAYSPTAAQDWDHKGIGIGIGLGLMVMTVWRYRCEQRLFWRAFNATFRHLWSRELMGLYGLSLVLASSLLWPTHSNLVTGGLSGSLLLTLLLTTTVIKRRNQTIIKRN